MSNIPYFEQLTDGEALNPKKAAALAFQVKSLSDSRPYKTYICAIDANGYQKVFYNDLPGTMTYTESSSGSWLLTSTGVVFTEQNTFITYSVGGAYISSGVGKSIYAFVVTGGGDIGKIKANWTGESYGYKLYLEVKVFI